MAARSFDVRVYDQFRDPSRLALAGKPSPNISPSRLTRNGWVWVFRLSSFPLRSSFLVACRVLRFVRPLELDVPLVLTCFYLQVVVELSASFAERRARARVLRHWCDDCTCSDFVLVLQLLEICVVVRFPLPLFFTFRRVGFSWFVTSISKALKSSFIVSFCCRTSQLLNFFNSGCRFSTRLPSPPFAPTLPRLCWFRAVLLWCT